MIVVVNDASTNGRNVSVVCDNSCLVDPIVLLPNYDKLAFNGD